jgi:hypothetical protein
MARSPLSEDRAVAEFEQALEDVLDRSIAE